jgi:hypothetical protein
MSYAWWAGKSEGTLVQPVDRNIDLESLGRQYVFDDTAPLHHDYCLVVFEDFRQLLPHDAGFGQAIEVKMIQREITGSVNFTDSKSRTRDMISTAYAPCQATHKGGFAATEVATKLNHFPALKAFAELLAELLGCV